MQDLRDRTRPARERAGYNYEAHLRGLEQAAQAAFVVVAEGFSPSGVEPPRKSWHSLKKRTAMDRLRARVLIDGRVQGVNFRASAHAQACTTGVEGWVRNLDDGRVEAVFEGPDVAVKRMISWCYSGPRWARVDQVDVAWEPPTGQERGFRIA